MQRTRTRPHGEVLDPAMLGPAEVSAWRELADGAAEPNVFLRPEFVLPGVPARAWSVQLLVVRDGDGRWLACLPVRRAARWRGVAMPSLVPWLPEYAYLATPLLRREVIREAADGLVALVARERRAGALVLDPFDASGPVGAALDAAIRRRGLTPVALASFERATLRRRAEGGYLEETLGRGSRKKLRSSKRALGRELGGEPEAVDRSADPGAVDRFLAMERAGWKGRSGTALASSPADARFFRRMCADMAAEAHLQILSLEVAGRSVAMQCNLRDGGVLFAFKVAFDPAFARFSPGALLEVEAIDVFHADPGLVVVDSCAAPDSPLVNRMWPDRRRLQTLLVPTGAPHARLLGAAVRGEAVTRLVRRRRVAPRRAAGSSTAPAPAR